MYPQNPPIETIFLLMEDEFKYENGLMKCLEIHHNCRLNFRLSYSKQIHSLISRILSSPPKPLKDSKFSRSEDYKLVVEKA